MSFIKINLNQTVSKAQREFIIEEKNRWYIFMGICALFLVSFMWLIFINSRLNHTISVRNNTIKSILKQTEELKSEGKINLSKKDINNLYKIETSRILWAEKLIALSKITPDDMAITKIEFKGGRLNISAVSNLGSGQKEFTVVENFMKKIEQNEQFKKDFKDIKFENLDKEFSKTDELLSFRVEAKLKKNKK